MSVYVNWSNPDTNGLSGIQPGGPIVIESVVITKQHLEGDTIVVINWHRPDEEETARQDHL